MSDQESGREGSDTLAAQPSTSAQAYDGQQLEHQRSAGAASDDRAGCTPSTGALPIAAPAAAQPAQRVVHWGCIPQELRERPQWLLAGPNARGELKVPTSITPDGRFHAGSSTNPATWLSFDRAADAAWAHGLGIGYVLSAGDPYTCIDLDVRNGNNYPDEPDRWTPQEDLHLYARMIEGFDSYCERSQSGQGLHIWVRGKIGAGRKRNGVEVYSQERFIACTGDVRLDRPIIDRQEYLSNMLTQMETMAERPPVIELVEVPPAEPNSAIFLRASTAANAEKFNMLWRGAWIGRPEYPSQSEADMALMAMLAFYSPSNQQCRDMFRESELGKRAKATKNDRYLDYTLRRIRSRMAAEAEALARVKIERWERIKKVGDGTLEPTPMPVLSADDMEKQLVFIRAKSFVAFLDRPTANAPLADMRNDFAASFTEIEEEDAKGEKRTAARPSIELWLKRPNRLRADTLTFDPRHGPFCADPFGNHALNLWRPRPHAAPLDWQARAQPFVKHVEFLVPMQAECTRFLDWLAHIEQNPGVLPHSGYLMVAPKQGVGRNWMAAVLAHVWKGHVALDFDLNQTLSSGFNGRLSRRLLAVIDEANEGHHGTATRNSEKFKSMVTATERHINPKYGFEHVEHNCCRWLIFSNYVSAIPIGDNDRRWNVVRNGDPMQDESYYAGLYTLLDDPLFIASVREWLRQRDLQFFNPGARPVMNEAKQAVIESVRSEADDRALELVRTWPRDVITGTELAQQLYDQDRQDGRLKYRAEQAGIVRWKGNGTGKVRLAGRTSTPVAVWIVRSADRWAHASLDTVLAELRRQDL
ncbi:DUF5906 domain-containing protein [Piscinibacter sp.]|uniref:phage NrS-1 polymerase family protein n=1 Tax=Piscinibacter sp. TaxID=1903157 RepID=UPI0039E21937